jgi:hypothetical protein
VKELQGMTTHKLAALASAPPVHPRDLILPSITLSSGHLGRPGITVCHSQALELEALPLKSQFSDRRRNF